MQRNQRWSVGLAKWPAVPLTPLLVAAMAAMAAMLCGCSVSEGVITTIGLPASQSAAPPDEVDKFAQPGAGRTAPAPEALTVSPQQRAYLDALRAAGVRPTDDIVALSIGSYVCQARAAKQTDQAVWDFVLPLVRGDVSDAHVSPWAPAVGEVDTVTADYIRIATERLC